MIQAFAPKNSHFERKERNTGLAESSVGIRMWCFDVELDGR